jgi:hypothetical protein
MHFIVNWKALTSNLILWLGLEHNFSPRHHNFIGFMGSFQIFAKSIIS